MVEGTDITDEESLRAWLKDQPREIAVWIAFRGAARVLPLCWTGMLPNDPAQKISLTALPILQCLLVSAVASKRPSTEIRSAAAFAVHNVSLAQNSTSHAVTACAKAACAANEEHFIEVVSDCAASLNRAMSNSLLFDGNSFRMGECFSSIARDAKDTPDGVVQDAKILWPLGVDHYSREWAAVKDRIAKAPDSTDWQFWIDWYDALLAGRTMLPDAARTWNMLEQIATETADADPETVNRKIREIWELHRLRAECAALRAEKDAFVAPRASEAQRSHNHPPDGLVDDHPEVAQQITIVGDTLDEAHDELEQDKPDKGRLRGIADRLLSALSAIVRYFGKLADVAARATAKKLGPPGAIAIIDQLANNGRLMQFAKNLFIYASGG